MSLQTRLLAGASAARPGVRSRSSQWRSDFAPRSLAGKRALLHYCDNAAGYQGSRDAFAPQARHHRHAQGNRQQSPQQWACAAGCCTTTKQPCWQGQRASARPQCHRAVRQRCSGCVHSPPTAAARIGRQLLFAGASPALAPGGCQDWSRGSGPGGNDHCCCMAPHPANDSPPRPRVHCSPSDPCRTASVTSVTAPPSSSLDAGSGPSTSGAGSADQPVLPTRLVTQLKLKSAACYLPHPEKVRVPWQCQHWAGLGWLRRWVCTHCCCLASCARAALAPWQGGPLSAPPPPQTRDAPLCACRSTTGARMRTL